MLQLAMTLTGEGREGARGEGREKWGFTACVIFLTSYDLDTVSIPSEVKPLLAMKMLDNLVDTSGYGTCDCHVTTHVTL